ncbi:hypothetical protein Lalb_Chr01g0016191 [Lupinus albus]|uniref:Uncharacterized protein n=1 Tax=Lupinus albus TaxID=3870 RepID=A0A6A4R6A1_LUPAL|nr:hypothetical protein Lalb_Chr01g0016191 [Lupinus albus]
MAFKDLKHDSLYFSFSFFTVCESIEKQFFHFHRESSIVLVYQFVFFCELVPYKEQMEFLLTTEVKERTLKGEEIRFLPAI